MSGISSTVTGALIAGGAALIGFGASAWNTRATVRANRQIARDERLWDKKTALYEALGEPTGDIETIDDVRAARATVNSLTEAAWLYASGKVRHQMIRFVIECGAALEIGELSKPNLWGINRVRVDLREAMRRDLYGPPEHPLRAIWRRWFPITTGRQILPDLESAPGPDADPEV
jgi:hypothetical protein